MKRRTLCTTSPVQIHTIKGGKAVIFRCKPLDLDMMWRSETILCICRMIDSQWQRHPFRYQSHKVQHRHRLLRKCIHGRQTNDLEDQVQERKNHPSEEDDLSQGGVSLAVREYANNLYDNYLCRIVSTCIPGRRPRK